MFLSVLQQETAASPERKARALAGLDAYQRAPRLPREVDVPTIAQSGRTRLIDYSRPGARGLPILFVPSLINPPFILDLAPGRSLLRWIAEAGLRPMLVDWGVPCPADRQEDIATHVATHLAALIDTLDAAPVLVGYCLGGTMAVAAAMLRDLSGLALIAAPWHFAGFGEATRARIGELWRSAKPTCDALGLVPMEVLQTGFWQLDPARTIAKFERFAELDPASAPARDFVALEDWANGGAPLTFAAGAELFEGLIAADRPGRGEWQVGGRQITPGALPCPLVEFVARNDRIVPAASALGQGDVRLLDAGHVGMIVGNRAREQLWQPLLDWLSATTIAK